MSWKLDKDRPICPQITDQLVMLIARGTFAPGERLKSVRELAQLFGVNPNTVQKAFEQLEARNIIHSVRGSGWYVNEDLQMAKDEADRIVRGKVTSFFDDMDVLGCSEQETKDLVERWSR